jgi:heptosyltransferase-1
VRLGALGDIIHAIPVAAALREAFPEARIDWLVSSRHKAILELVSVIDRVIVLETGEVASKGRWSVRPEYSVTTLTESKGERPGGPRRPAPDGRGQWRTSSWFGLAGALGEMRRARYDIAFELQGLLKSAAIARASGARRVVGFARAHLREKCAYVFHTESCEPPDGGHVVDKNLSTLAAVGLRDVPARFPLAVPASPALDTLVGLLSQHAARVEDSASPDAWPLAPDGRSTGSRAGSSSVQQHGFVLLNPAAGWPNKRWPPEWFGELARHIGNAHGLPCVVLWGPTEETLARLVVEASRGAALLAPPTSVHDVVALASAAALFVSGDTGPLHIAAAVGAPVVGIYGPTDPARNGPWNPDDESVSRFGECECHHKRRCRREQACIMDISVDEVVAAVERRLSRERQ